MCEKSIVIKLIRLEYLICIISISIRFVALYIGKNKDISVIKRNLNMPRSAAFSLSHKNLSILAIL